MYTAWLPGGGDDTDSLCIQNIWTMVERQEQAIWLIWLFAILFRFIGTGCKEHVAHCGNSGAP